MASKPGNGNGKLTTKTSTEVMAPSTGPILGMEGADKDAFAIPFLQVLQKGSPQCDPDDPAYMKGATPGMILNTVTQELIDGKVGVVALPCSYQRRWVRWGAREAGGGFKGEFTTDQVNAMRASGQVQDLENRSYILEGGEAINPKRNDRVADTRNHFLLILANGTVQPALLALTSTQIKKSKLLMSQLSMILERVPANRKATFGVPIRITTVPESNDKGSWYGVKFSPPDGESYKTLPVNDQSVFDAARGFYEQVSSGQVIATPPTTGDVEEDATKGF